MNSGDPTNLEMRYISRSQVVKRCCDLSLTLFFALAWLVRRCPRHKPVQGRIQQPEQQQLELELEGKRKRYDV